MWHKTNGGETLINLDKITSLSLVNQCIHFYEPNYFEDSGYYQEHFKTLHEAEKAYEELSGKLLQGE